MLLDFEYVHKLVLLDFEYVHKHTSVYIPKIWNSLSGEAKISDSLSIFNSNISHVSLTND